MCKGSYNIKRCVTGVSGVADVRFSFIAFFVFWEVCFFDFVIGTALSIIFYIFGFFGVFVIFVWLIVVFYFFGFRDLFGTVRDLNSVY